MSLFVQKPLKDFSRRSEKLFLTGPTSFSLSNKSFLKHAKNCWSWLFCTANTVVQKKRDVGISFSFYSNEVISIFSRVRFVERFSVKKVGVSKNECVSKMKIEMSCRKTKGR